MTAQLCACGDELVTQKEVEGGMCETCRMLIDNDLSELLIAAMKELGEIAECLIVNNRSVEDTIKNYRPNHWKNELGDLCGLAIAPMLKLAEMDFETACEIGRARKKAKMEENSA